MCFRPDQEDLGLPSINSLCEVNLTDLGATGVQSDFTFGLVILAISI